MGLQAINSLGINEKIFTPSVPFIQNSKIHLFISAGLGYTFVIADMIRNPRMFIMQRLFFILIIIFSVETLNKADAASLIMVEQQYCEYCESWNADIGVIYNKTAEGKRVPLRRIDIHEPLPDDLNFLTGLIFTPTFVLVNEGKEVGRIQGYASESFFWGLLQKLLEKLPADKQSNALETKNIFLARSQIDNRLIGKELVYD